MMAIVIWNFLLLIIDTKNKLSAWCYVCLLSDNTQAQPNFCKLFNFE